MTDDKTIEAALAIYNSARLAGKDVPHGRVVVSAIIAAADKVRAEGFDFEAEAKLALRCGECDLPEGQAECLCQQVINDMVGYGRRAYTAGASYSRVIDDGSCQRCGAIPRDANGLCATCRDELEEWRVRESETQEELQKLGEEFGVHSGEPRVSGIRRILAEQRAGLAKGEAELAEERATREIERDLNDDQLKEAERIIGVRGEEIAKGEADRAVLVEALREALWYVNKDSPKALDLRSRALALVRKGSEEWLGSFDHSNFNPIANGE